MTLLHHAEHLARIPDKRLHRYQVPFATSAGVVWRILEEFDTRDPVVPGLKDDNEIIGAFLATGQGDAGLDRRGKIGAGRCDLHLQLLSHGWRTMSGLTEQLSWRPEGPAHPLIGKLTAHSSTRSAPSAAKEQTPHGEVGIAKQHKTMGETHA